MIPEVSREDELVLHKIKTSRIITKCGQSQRRDCGKSVLSARYLAGENVLQEQRCKNVRKHVTDVKRGKKPNQLKVRAKNI